MPRAYTRLVTTPAAARMVRDAVRPFVSLTTDFGVRDPSAAICRAVVLGIAPDALVVDVSHEVGKYRIEEGALLLWCAVPYLPIGAHVAVVDPGVGTERLPLAVETLRGDVLIGPDNGILLPAAERLGGITRAHVLHNPNYRLPVVTASFHGRDIFSPAAAHIALGVPVEALGPAIHPELLVRAPWPRPEITDGAFVTSIIYLDTFGNVKLVGEPAELAAAIGPLRWGDPLVVGYGRRGEAYREATTWAETFGRVQPGQPLLYEDSYGRLCLADNQGAIARRLRLEPGLRVTIRRPPEGQRTGG